MVGELSLLSALAARHLMRAHLVHNHSQANTPMSLRPVTPRLIASNIVWEQKTAKKSLGPAPEPVLSHSLSTTSLRLWSLPDKGSYIWPILTLVPAGKPSTGAGTGLRSSYPQSSPYPRWQVRVFARYGYGSGHWYPGAYPCSSLPNLISCGRLHSHPHFDALLTAPNIFGDLRGSLWCVVVLIPNYFGIRSSPQIISQVGITLRLDCPLGCSPK